MSKASEWAEKHYQAAKEMPQLKSSAGGVIAELGHVCGAATVEIRNDTLFAEDAVKLARWILDTFGEAQS